jgi:glycosyltransferase involved in cell wall biosynthesis
LKGGPVKSTKIVMIEASGKGKLSHSTFGLCSSLADHGYDVTLATSQGYEMDGLPRKFEVRKIFPENGKALTPGGIYRTLKIIFEINPAVIHFQWFPSPFLMLLTLKIIRLTTSAKLIYTPHNLLPHKNRFRHTASWARIYKKMDGLIAHSDYCRAALMDVFDVESEKIFVVPDYICLDELANAYGRGESRRAAGLSPEDKIVLFFGYINASKGLGDLIFAFAELRKTMPGVRLIIAGQPEEDFGLYRQILEGLSLVDEVTLDLRYVPLPAALRYFSSADVVALPYRKVCQSPITYLARAFGVPVIVTGASKRSGPGQINVGSNGVVAALTEALYKALTSPAGGSAQDSSAMTAFTRDLAEQTHRAYCDLR